uniref:Uncharacterized protein n=1 Tax=Glossina palpalis gambiensis TaxID=67801 RepID=A0A1B0AZW7_9MUSC
MSRSSCSWFIASCQYFGGLSKLEAVLNSKLKELVEKGNKLALKDLDTIITSLTDTSEKQIFTADHSRVVANDAHLRISQDNFSRMYAKLTPTHDLFNLNMLLDKGTCTATKSKFLYENLKHFKFHFVKHQRRIHCQLRSLFNINPAIRCELNAYNISWTCCYDCELTTLVDIVVVVVVIIVNTCMMFFLV